MNLMSRHVRGDKAWAPWIHANEFPSRQNNSNEPHNTYVQPSRCFWRSVNFESVVVGIIYRRRPRLLMVCARTTLHDVSHWGWFHFPAISLFFSMNVRGRGRREEWGGVRLAPLTISFHALSKITIPVVMVGRTKTSQRLQASHCRDSTALFFWNIIYFKNNSYYVTIFSKLQFFHISTI